MIAAFLAFAAPAFATTAPAFDPRRHKQGILEQIAKAVQLGAERRLAHMQPGCGPCDVALDKQSFETDEEVEIDALHIHDLYSSA